MASSNTGLVSGACAVCGSSVPFDLDRCSTCGSDVGAPNVRSAEAHAELAALETRYSEVVGRCAARGTGPVLRRFETALERSSAVISCDLSTVRNLIENSKSLYTNYHQTVRAGIRKAATEEFDRHRRAVDALLFGRYGEELTFAALSLTGRGLCSYGGFFLQLRDIAVAGRATLLEENSFNFVEHHNLGFGTQVPLGYRSSWNKRARLVVAKLADQLSADTSDDDFANFLLFDSGERKNDQFVEVQIYGNFDLAAVDRIYSPQPKGGAERTTVAVLKELFENSGRRWGFYD